MLELRSYQLEDVEFIQERRTAGCFNEQRTGKTPTILTVLKNKGFKKIVIVCPKSAVYPWLEEFVRWTGLPCVALSGSREKKEKLLDLWECGLIVGYDTLKTTTTADGFIKEVLAQNPDAVVIDEAHRIKNPSTATAKAIFKLIKVPNRYTLTGTPANNKAHEIWAILHFLRPDMFKSQWDFNKEYFHTFPVRAPNGSSYIDIGSFKPLKAVQLQLILKGLSTQRKRKDVMPWLPEKDYQRIHLPPTREQTKYLTELQKYFETGDGTIVTQGVLDRLVRYRQICLAPELLGLKGSSPKINWIKDYLADYPDQPVIIFSKFTSFLKILAHYQECPNQLIIGETSSEERNDLIKSFQSGKIKLLLINIDAGKEAITLDTAETIIFTDKYPPVGDIAQAEDRFVATTEDKKDKPHTIIELMMKGTFDEDLYSLLEKRASETDILNNYNKYLKRR
jgi:SNF2 family DNA or RNA helicase